MMKESRSYTLEGMSCQNCVRHVRRSLQSLEGVEIRDVSVGSASIEFDPALVSENDILSALSNAGYPATPQAA
jgi:copper chaperone CopZ